MSEDKTSNIMFEREHFDTLRDCIAKDEDVKWKAAKAPGTFAKHLGLTAAFGVSEKPESRCHLQKDREAAIENIEVFALRILAWGGMRVNNGRYLFGNEDKGWLNLCADIAAGRYDRAEAYDAFAGLRNNGRIKGLGPAYFTKLIYFLMPQHNYPVGYIMDQWVSCAINILATDPIVKLRNNFVVSDANNGSVYERYCCAIELLAKSCSISPDNLEIQLMSKGGHKPASWRQYVMTQRKSKP